MHQKKDGALDPPPPKLICNKSRQHQQRSQKRERLDINPHPVLEGSVSAKPAIVIYNIFQEKTAFSSLAFSAQPYQFIFTCIFKDAKKSVMKLIVKFAILGAGTMATTTCSHGLGTLEEWLARPRT